VSAAPAPDLRRLLALLADRALLGLGAREAEELRELLAACPDLDEHVFERAAAQLDLALAPAPEEALPASLRRALLEDLEARWKEDEPEETEEQAQPEIASAPAVDFIDPVDPSEPGRLAPLGDATAADAARDAAAEPLVLGLDPEPIALDLDPEPLRGESGFGLELGAEDPLAAPRTRRPARALRARRAGPSRSLVWLAVACLALTFVGLRLRGGAEIAAPSDEHAEAHDSLHLAWRPGSASGPAVAGDLVWSDEAQRGRARLTGLPANDPSQTRYQIWIVDSERGGQAVPAGLFDVAPDAQAVEIEIRPALPVARPLRFAITQEKPGGVLTSRFDRTVAISRKTDNLPPVAATPR
jgi:hypothetical protein